jgi:hypothetical protein
MFQRKDGGRQARCGSSIDVDVNRYAEGSALITLVTPGDLHRQPGTACPPGCAGRGRVE